MTLMILVPYDGSADAQAAIDHAALLMPGAAATVLTVWEPFADIMARSGAMDAGGMSFAGSYADGADADAISEQAARDTAQQGADRARRGSLVASPRIARQHGGVAEAILAAARELDADAVVLGTRGRGNVKSFLLGSVSHEVVQHADRTVVVVPSPALAERRRGTAPAEAVGGMA